MIHRSRTIDIARSLAILGVVLGHAIFGLRGAGLYAADALPMQLQEAWSIGRMPAMFFLVGLFIPRAVERRDAGGRSYIRERLVLLLWVYLVWQLVQALLEVAGSPLKNVPVSPAVIVEVWAPLAHLWFLPTLALGTVVVVLARPWDRLWTLVPFAVMAVLWWATAPEVIGLQGFSNVFFLALGAAITLRRLTAWTRRPALLHSAGAASLLMFVGGAAMQLTRHPRHAAGADLIESCLSFATAVAGVAALVWVAALIALLPFAVTGWVDSIGRQTLEVFCAHIAFMSVARIVAMKMGLTDPTVLLLLTFVLGVVGPLVLATVARRLHMGWLYRAPRPLADWSTRTHRR